VRFLLSGYYGFGNLGDEALLAIIAAELKTRYPFATIDALSSDPEKTKHDLGIEATPRWDQGAIRDAISASDVVLSGGGGLLQNATSLKSLLYYANIIRTAIRAGKKTMVFAQSIGPLDFWGKQTVREFCKGLTAATARDGRSRDLLASIVSAIEVERTADPVLLYEAPERQPDLARYGLGAGSEPLVIVCARKTAHLSDAAAVLAVTIDRLAQRHGARVALVPFDGVADCDFATTVIKKCDSKPSLVELNGLDEVAAAIASARLVIGVRFHALVLALRFGVPFLHIAYDPKVSGLVDDIGYPLEAIWAPGQRPSASHIEALVDRAWLERDTLAATVAAAYPAQRELAQKNFTVLDGVVRAIS
jgi:polysaccharide pyruvyl transferase CsaB